MQSFHVLLPLQSSRFRFIPVKGVLPFCGGDFERDVCVHQHWHSSVCQWEEPLGSCEAICKRAVGNNHIPASIGERAARSYLRRPAGRAARSYLIQLVNESYPNSVKLFSVLSLA